MMMVIASKYSLMVQADKLTGPPPRELRFNNGMNTDYEKNVHITIQKGFVGSIMYAHSLMLIILVFLVY